MTTQAILTASVSERCDTARATGTKSWKRFIPAVARVLMGLPFFVGGICGLLLPPMKVEMSAGAMAFSGALVNSGYMMPLIFSTQLVVGAMLLANRFVPLALVLIAPFMVNSLGFHLFLEHSGLPGICVFLAFEMYLVWTYRRAYEPIFTARTTPGLN